LVTGAARTVVESIVAANKAIRIFMVELLLAIPHYRHRVAIAPAPDASCAKMAACFLKER
jgi:hypothetical protein